MPKLTIGTPVAIKASVLAGLSFPCNTKSDLYIAVNPGALKVPAVSLTVVVERVGNEITWVGAVDENMLDVLTEPSWPQARQALCDRIGIGAYLWEIRFPGKLLKPGTPSGMVYQGSRPWLIIGELANGAPLAVPLNSTTASATNKPYNMFLDKSWYLVTPSDSDPRILPSDTNSTAELPHIWSLPNGQQNCGNVISGNMSSLVSSLNIYYPASNGQRKP